MKTTKTKSFFLFFSIFLILLIQIIPIVPFSVANTVTPVVRSDWLYVTTGNFVDISPDSLENKIWIQSGGKDLISFTPLGVVTDETTDDIIVYKARAKFGFEVTLHTSVTFRDIYPDISTTEMHKEPFFAVVRQYMYPVYTTVIPYVVEWASINYGARKINHDYNGHIPITIGLKEFSDTTGSMNINGQTISTPSYTSDIIQADVVNIRDGVVGGYEDIFTDATGVAEGRVTFKTTQANTPEQGEVADWLEGKNLGWTKYNETHPENLQGSIIYGEGGTKDNTDPAKNKEFTFTLGAELQPEVYQYHQTLELRTAVIKFTQDWLGNWAFSVPGSPATRKVKRVVGVHVTNNFIHWDLEAIVDIYATVQSNAELTEAVLADPYLRMGDYIWDSSYYGVIEVDVWIPPDTNLLLLLVIILFVVVILYVVYRMYKKRSQQSFMLALAGRK